MSRGRVMSRERSVLTEGWRQWKCKKLWFLQFPFATMAYEQSFGGRLLGGRHGRWCQQRDPMFVFLTVWTEGWERRGNVMKLGFGQVQQCRMNHMQ